MDFHEQQPIYLQIVDYVCERVLLKHWNKGDRVPSVRELAVTLEVNPNTVMRAYEFLQHKEIVYNQRGLGLFVADDGIKNARAYRQEEFMQKEVPAFFASMTLLQISVEEVESLFKKYKKSKV
ncbi:MAG: GntR family transcriptional regulator [Chryseolinea sp.]